MDESNIIECGGFYFIHNFDSGNLGHVERVPTELIAPCVNQRNNTQETPDYEFNLWTRPDCAGTEFENGNRTWFNFGIQASVPGCLVRLNLINLNKQGKMYNQGMAPVTRTLPGKPHWERIRDKPIHSTDDNTFTLSFKYRTSENLKATTFFAFTYPFSFAELQISLNSIDMKMLPLPLNPANDDIYYCRECLIYSLEGRRVDLLTISSHHGISTEKEERLKNLFPENQDRPFKFVNKKVIFISARVHPGETPSSFVFNGFLNLLLNRTDPIAIQLRKLYVFKMIPFLNPDGVARGHYRTDTRGVNLNRVYLNPSLTHHPTIYASRSLIRYYHYGYEREETSDESRIIISRSIQNIESVQYIEQDTNQNKKRTSPVTSAGKKEPRKREKSGKPLTGNKSTITLVDLPAPKSVENMVQTVKNAKSRNADTTHLAGQVNDMNLQEIPNASLASEDGTSGLLNDNVLRSCLGSTVHLSNSEELEFEGSNPLRPLRDTLKNSISLLMGSTGSSTCYGSEIPNVTEPRLPNVKVGWCKECRRAIAKLEDTMPGIANMLPGYGIAARNTTCHSIDEYREQQRKQLDHQERKVQQDMEATEKTTDTVYFCTNCFKRYTLTEQQEETECSIARECSLPTTTTLLSSMTTATETSLQAAGDVSVSLLAPAPSKEDKPKSPPAVKQSKKKSAKETIIAAKPVYKEPESGLYLYIDLHGHASKKGIFMYGNHFEDLESSVECMLLPRIMSLNNLHFHFSSCNFTERNMYLKDRRDGMSREGSGRVAVLKATGLVRSYTLECNYNTGRLVNVLPPAVRDTPPAPPPPAQPPKYTPSIFEEVGRSLGASILDLTGQHPNSRIPGSEHRNLSAIREWLRTHSKCTRPQLTMSRLRPKMSPSRVPLYQRKTTEDRKENAYAGSKEVEAKRSAGAALTSRPDVKLNKRNEPVKSSSRTKYDSESKVKSMSSKRRNVLGIRKPNSSKTAVGVVKGKAKRSSDDSESRKRLVCRAMASSSSDDVSSWEARPSQSGVSECGVGKRRSFAAPPPAMLKKIRLKTAL